MAPLIAGITALLSLATLAADVALVLLALGFIFSRQSFMPLARWAGAHAAPLCFFAAAAAVLGSLFFSNVAGFVPCELCWWQRVCIYPQVVLFGLAWVYQRRGKALGPVFSVSGILSLVSLCIGLFQYYGATWNAGALAGCAASGVSCAKTYFVEFGYVTIPVMAITIAATLLAILWARRAA